MADAFFAQKIKTLFTRFDADKNGKIEGSNLIRKIFFTFIFIFIFI